ncbi:MAG: pyrroline-5-carboxylate reductase [Deltaproteobacteria bacterium]|nr:pyrroline-5-carboxylate reductase [Deltaproteobacteria bacterium]
MHISILGCGAMGGALLRGLKHDAGNVLSVFDRNPEKAVEASTGAKAKVTISSDVASAVKDAEVVLLVIKPQGIAEILQETAAFAPEAALFISCAAGVSLSTLEEAAPGTPVARCMPNTGSALGKGTTGIFFGGTSIVDEELPRAKQVLSALGEVHLLPNEDAFHAMTALCGSGPAYFLLAIEAMVDEGVRLGMKREQAAVYARGALRAASALLDDDAAGEALGATTLRSHITSPGGTTIAGLMAMEAEGRTAFKGAVRAAERRSREMHAGRSSSDFVE